jgi:hypothetical protein
MNAIWFPTSEETVSRLKTVTEFFERRCATADSRLALKQTNVDTALGQQSSDSKPANAAPYYNDFTVHVRQKMK